MYIQFHIYVYVKLRRNGKMNLHVYFYVEARLKIHHYHITMMYIYSSFSPFILSPLVEWYVNDIDKS